MYEIERRFLIKDMSLLWKDIELCTVSTEDIYQGYMLTNPDKTIRVRLTSNRKTGKNQAYLTVKGKTSGCSKMEIEEEISLETAGSLYRYFCDSQISKTRYSVKLNDMIWEIDAFDTPNHGLWIAEIELTSEDQPIIIPDWIGEEITNDHRYSNANLSKNSWPFN